MDNIPTIKLSEMFDKKYAISLEDAEKLYSVLKTSLDEKKKVIISFEGIELLITAFLNASFGKLFKDYAEKDIASYIEVINLPEDKNALLQLVKERAIHFYRKENDSI